MLVRHALVPKVGEVVGPMVVEAVAMVGVVALVGEGNDAGTKLLVCCGRRPLK